MLFVGISRLLNNPLKLPIEITSLSFSTINLIDNFAAYDIIIEAKNREDILWLLFLQAFGVMPTL